MESETGVSETPLSKTIPGPCLGEACSGGVRNHMVSDTWRPLLTGASSS